MKSISKTIFDVTGPPRKHKEWLTHEIIDITNKKSHAFLEWQNHRGTHNETKYRTQYFSELFNVPTIAEYTNDQEIPVTQVLLKEQKRQDKSPSLEEIEEAIRRMKGGKAPGIDDISADIIKAGGRLLSTRLHKLFVEIWEQEETIDDWSTALIIRLFKNKGDKRNCGNYHRISLLPVARKIFSRLILNRVQNHLGKQILRLNQS